MQDNLSIASGQNAVVSGLRWIAALPGGLIAAVLAMFPAHWVLMLLYYLKSMPSDYSFMTDLDGKPVPFFGISFETMERCVMAVLVPTVFILAGAWIAPTYKWATAVVFGVLWILFMTVGVTFAASTDRFEVEFTLTTFIILGLNGAGVVYALRTAFLKHSKSSR